MTVRIGFLAAVALIAAAIGDPCVEVAANTGMFGSGYADHNHLGAVPALSASLTLVAGLLVLRAIDVWRRKFSANSARRSLAAWLAVSRSPLLELARLAPLQLAAVYGMECLEALMADRPLPMGLVWLGAPPIFSLATHLAVGAACSWAMRRVVRALLEGLDALVHVAAELVTRLAPRPPQTHAFTLAREAAWVLRAAPSHARRVRGRAPPPFLLRPAF